LETTRPTKQRASRQPKSVGSTEAPLPARLLGALLGRPAVPLAAALVLTLLAGFGVTRVRFDASAELLADTGSAAYADQVRFADFFGADPVVVMVEPAKGQQLLSPDRLVGMAQLEGDLARLHGVRHVYGPGTLVNTFASEVTRRALDLCGTQGKQAEGKAVADAKAAGKSTADQTAAGQQAFDATVRACAGQLAAQYPTLGVPALNNPGFYQELLLEPSGSVRPFWKAVLPDANHALIEVRMDRAASLADVEAVLHRVQSATSGPATRMVVTSSGQQVSTPTTAGELAGTRFSVTGTPAVAAEMAGAVRSSLVWLLPLTVLAMLAISALVLRVRHRLVAVPLAVLAGLWAVGFGAIAGLPVTPATLAVLPVVLGLTTDYVLQVANRMAEERGLSPGPMLRAARSVGPAIALAGVATAAGVLAFAVSSVPLVRQFALFMAIGVAASLAAGVLVGLPLVSLVARRLTPPGAPATLDPPDEIRTPSPQFHGDPGDVAVSSPPSWPRLAGLGRLPRPLVVMVALVGVLGWVVVPLIRVETDPVKLLPPGSPSVQQAEHVRQVAGSVGELDLAVTGPDVTSPSVVAWMAGAEDRVASRDLTPITGLPQFLVTFNYGQPPDAATTGVILDRMPSYLTQAVASPDGHLARVAFGVPRLTSVEQDSGLVRGMDRAGQPPAGYHAYPAGLAVVAASALDRLTADRTRLTLLALALVVVVLFVGFRSPVPALLAVLPTVLAAGWGTGLMWLVRAQETPLTVLLAGVVVAFATEFGVLWLSRYRAERRAGTAADEAAAVASRRVGPAIVASAAALVAGFAALAVSSAPVVRDFGLWCAGDLALATLAVLTVLPPAARAWLR
jgi:hydrophobe/amphiphile efflux-3 (HAE3) family protein